MASSTPTPAPAASSGLTNNLAAALVYIPFFIGLILGIVFLVIEPYNKTRLVRFHAFQSIFLHVALVALGIVWQVLMVILGLMSQGLVLFLAIPVMWLFFLGVLVLLVYCAIQAYGSKEFKLPFIGDLAAKQAGA
jgi:uncharacterized membrane protein